MNLPARNQTDGDQTAAFFSKKTAKKLKSKEYFFNFKLNIVLFKFIVVYVDKVYNTHP